MVYYHTLCHSPPLKGLVKGFCSKLLVNMSKSLFFVLNYILCTCSHVQGGLETGKACEQRLAQTGYSCIAVWEMVVHRSTSVVMSLVAVGPAPY